MRQQSNFSTLCRAYHPEGTQSRDDCGLHGSCRAVRAHYQRHGYISLRRLSDDELNSTEKNPDYREVSVALFGGCELSGRYRTCHCPVMRIGDKMLCLHTLSDTDDLPGKRQHLIPYMSGYRLTVATAASSFASPVGLLLPCNHIYNQYVFIDDHDENLAKFRKDQPET